MSADKRSEAFGPDYNSKEMTVEDLRAFLETVPKNAKIRIWDDLACREFNPSWLIYSSKDNELTLNNIVPGA